MGGTINLLEDLNITIVKRLGYLSYGFASKIFVTKCIGTLFPEY